MELSSPVAERARRGWSSAARGRLADLGVAKVFEVLIEIGELRLFFAGLCEVVLVFGAEGVTAGEAVVAALVSVIHGKCLSMLVSGGIATNMPGTIHFGKMQT